MQVDILVTNGGAHPADKWAALAAGKISDLIQIDEASGESMTAARKAKPRFALAVADAIEPSFSDIFDAEVAAVNNGTVAVRHAPFSIDAFISPAIAAIVGAAAGTPFADHFSLADVQAVVGKILAQYFIDAANIDRSWALDAKGL